MADTCDDVPPLEDMSEMIKQVINLRDKRSTSELIPKAAEEKGRPDKQEKLAQPNASIPTCQTHRELKVNKVTNEKKSIAVKETTFAQKCQSDSGSYGGMKKGFLFGGSGASKKTTTLKKQDSPNVTDNIPCIKPRYSKEKELEFPEVQQAMDASEAFARNKEWVTEDLLKNIMGRPKMAEKFVDPSFMTAVAEFQSNPSEAMAKYSENAEMLSFLNEFCGLIGEHFSGIAEKQEEKPMKKKSNIISSLEPGDAAELRVSHITNQEQITVSDEKRMREILAMPDIRAILMEPRIQELLDTLRHRPDQAQGVLRKADPALHRQIRKLMDVGLLQFDS